MLSAYSLWYIFVLILKAHRRTWMLRLSSEILLGASITSFPRRYSISIHLGPDSLTIVIVMGFFGSSLSLILIGIGSGWTRRAVKVVEHKVQVFYLLTLKMVLHIIVPMNFYFDVCISLPRLGPWSMEVCLLLLLDVAIILELFILLLLLVVTHIECLSSYIIHTSLACLPVFIINIFRILGSLLRLLLTGIIPVIKIRSFIMILIDCEFFLIRLVKISWRNSKLFPCITISDITLLITFLILNFICIIILVSKRTIYPWSVIKRVNWWFLLSWRFCERGLRWVIWSGEGTIASIDPVQAIFIIIVSIYKALPIRCDKTL